jgi:hypothetical protein
VSRRVSSPHLLPLHLLKILFLDHDALPCLNDLSQTNSKKERKRKGTGKEREKKVEKRKREDQKRMSYLKLSNPYIVW